MKKKRLVTDRADGSIRATGCDDTLFWAEMDQISREQISWCLDKLGVDHGESWFWRENRIWFAREQDLLLYLLRWS